MKAGMMFGLMAGACMGAVIATMYKPARDVINKGKKVAKQATKDIISEL